MPCVSLCSKRTNSTPSAVICSSSAARSNVLRAAVLRVGIGFLLKSHYLFQKVSVGRAGEGFWQAFAELSCIRCTLAPQVVFELLSNSWPTIQVSRPQVLQKTLICKLLLVSTLRSRPPERDSNLKVTWLVSS